MSVTSGETALKPLSIGGNRSGSAGISMIFRIAQVLPSLNQTPDRRRQILKADHRINEAICLCRIVRRPEFEHELILRAEIDFLLVLARVQTTKVQLWP